MTQRLSDALAVVGNLTQRSLNEAEVIDAVLAEGHQRQSGDGGRSERAGLLVEQRLDERALGTEAAVAPAGGDGHRSRGAQAAHGGQYLGVVHGVPEVGLQAFGELRDAIRPAVIIVVAVGCSTGDS